MSPSVKFLMEKSLDLLRMRAIVIKLRFRTLTNSFNSKPLQQTSANYDQVFSILSYARLASIIKHSK